ncbi:MAG: DUF1844 domain-containing protein [Chloroherpetonaceae bacterium]|nr:DUF1844 domain-containing protein [Chthonomonadaceae bacterium]MDW8206991.1 DUF1844 domain-containing protein [Chloroherpetonaceae bacterium]
MSEPSSPEFKVVDRRSASSESPGTAADTASQETTAADAAEAPTSEQGKEAPYDPISLVLFGAMQVETRELLHALFEIFGQHAWVAMGLVADPRTGQPRVDLSVARLAIDCAHFVLDKIRVELSEEERRDAERRLNDLRMNYLMKSEQKGHA